MVKKRGYSIVFGPLIGWILAILVLVVSVVTYLVISGKVQGAADFLGNLFRFGGSP